MFAPHYEDMISYSGDESSELAGSAQISRMGCSNWDRILLGSSSLPSPHECMTTCSSTPGCASFNYQPGVCGTTEGVAPGTCYTYGEGCVEKANTCWDLYYMSLPTPATWQLSASRTGCANWESIATGSTKTGLSSGECG